jgi:hypothetical protein
MDKLSEVYAYPEIKELIKRKRGLVRRDEK